MNREVAYALAKSFLERIHRDESGCGHFEGKLSALELQALEYLLAKTPVGEEPPKRGQSSAESPENESTDPDSVLTAEGEGSEGPGVELDLSALEASEDDGARLCIDFGTAMSKATVVQDDSEGDVDEISVLPLGVPGGQQDISETMLVSSVLIDVEGRLWFGQEAVELSYSEPERVGKRIDNIKRRISEGGLREPVSEESNPTNIRVTYEQLIIAYLTYLTWCTNETLVELGYPRNITRRYASPCFDPERTRKIQVFMRSALGEAQVLADTLGSEINSGINLTRFLHHLEQAQGSGFTYDFVTRRITEPVGVVGAQVSWQTKIDHLMIVIDVGAGTTDFGFFRIAYDPENDVNAAYEIENSARGVAVAGNHLDRVLQAMIIDKSGIEPGHPEYKNILSNLQMHIRDYKETLFNEGSVFVPLSRNEDLDVEVDLEEFLELDSVRQFGETLRRCMQEVFIAQEGWSDWVLEDPKRSLTVVLTGGGAQLPMVRELAQSSLDVDGRMVPVAQAVSFPMWLQKDHPEFEEDYPRIAVSLGGARRKIFLNEGRMGSAPPRETADFELSRF